MSFSESVSVLMDSILLSFAFQVFCKILLSSNREDLLNLMELAKDSPDAKRSFLTVFCPEKE